MKGKGGWGYVLCCARRVHIKKAFIRLYNEPDAVAMENKAMDGATN